MQWPLSRAVPTLALVSLSFAAIPHAAHADDGASAPPAHISGGPSLAKQMPPQPPPTGAPASPPTADGAPALAAPAPVPLEPGPLDAEPGMYSVGMYAGGIALVIGGIVNAGIGAAVFGTLATQGGGDGFGGVIGLLIGGPLMFDGTVQISVGIPMIVVGGADAEPAVNQRTTAAQPFAYRDGLTLSVPF